jgi:hypothetical protein
MNAPCSNPKCAEGLSRALCSKAAAKGNDDMSEPSAAQRAHTYLRIVAHDAGE